MTSPEGHHIRRPVNSAQERRDETGATRTPPRLAVFGANGGSGRALLKEALAAGHHVTAITRHPEQFANRPPNLLVLGGDATNEADVLTAVKGADVVLSTLGVPYSRSPISLYSESARCIIKAMKHAQIRRLVVVTSSAVMPEAHPEGGLLGKLVIGPLITRLGRTTYDDMRRMEAIVQASDLDWTIFRPPALFDKEAPGPVEISLEPLDAHFTARQDLAVAMLAEIASTEHYQRALYTSSLEGKPNIWRTIWRDAIRKQG